MVYYGAGHGCDIWLSNGYYFECSQLELGWRAGGRAYGGDL
jgi:hypothetical protein